MIVFAFLAFFWVDKFNQIKISYVTCTVDQAIETNNYYNISGIHVQSVVIVGVLVLLLVVVSFVLPIKFVGSTLQCSI